MKINQKLLAMEFERLHYVPKTQRERDENGAEFYDEREQITQTLGYDQFALGVILSVTNPKLDIVTVLHNTLAVALIAGYRTGRAAAQCESLDKSWQITGQDIIDRFQEKG